MSPAEDLQRKIVRALRHGEFGFRGSFERGGYVSMDALKASFGGGEALWSDAFRIDQQATGSRGWTSVGRATSEPFRGIPWIAAMSSASWPLLWKTAPLRTCNGRTASTSTTGQTSMSWTVSSPMVCSQEADRAVASQTTS